MYPFRDSNPTALRDRNSDHTVLSAVLPSQPPQHHKVRRHLQRSTSGEKRSNVAMHNLINLFIIEFNVLPFIHTQSILCCFLHVPTYHV